MVQAKLVSKQRLDRLVALQTLMYGGTCMVARLLVEVQRLFETFGRCVCMVAMGPSLDQPTYCKQDFDHQVEFCHP